MKYHLSLIFVLLIFSVSAFAQPKLESVSETIDKINQQVGILINHNDFSALDKMAEEFRTNSHPLAKAPWSLSVFYEAFKFGSTELNHRDRARYEDFFSRWKLKNPDSLAVNIARATLLHSWGWAARGSGFANVVSEAGWEGYRRDLKSAWDILSNLRSRSVNNSHIYSLLILIGRDLSIERDTLRQLFDEGVKVNPNDWGLYSYYSKVFDKYWGGRPGEIEAFADYVYKTNPGGQGKILYAKIAAWQLTSCKQGEFRIEFSFSWEKIKEGFEEIISNSKPTQKDIHHLARLSIEFSDKEVAKRAFSILGESWDKEASALWISVENFKKWRLWATSDADSPGPKEIHIAAGQGDILKMEESIKASEDINSLDVYKQTALFHAIYRNQWLAVEWLIAKGIKVNHRNKRGSTALHEATRLGNLAIVKFLLKNGADSSIMDHDGNIPLHIASANGFLPLVKIFIESNGSDVNSRNATGRTPLHLSSSNAHIEVIKYLLEKPGINVNSIDQWHYTPLHAAASGANAQTVELLINKGAQINLKDMYGATPLRFAEKKSKNDIIVLMRSKGAH